MCRLLVIDDVRNERQLIADRALSVCDTIEEVRDVASAAKALNRGTRRPDMIVAALDADGTKLVDTLYRQSDGVQATPIVLIVEPGWAGRAAVAASAGIWSLIRRPLDGITLNHVLRQVLAELRGDEREAERP